LSLASISSGLMHMQHLNNQIVAIPNIHQKKNQMPTILELVCKKNESVAIYVESDFGIVRF